VNIAELMAVSISSSVASACGFFKKWDGIEFNAYARPVEI